MALLLALIIWGLAAFTGFLLVDDRFWLPPGISEAAGKIDGGIVLTLIVTGIAFILAQFLLGLFIFLYRDRGQAKARYIHGHNMIEYGGMLVTAVVFVALAIAGQRVWAAIHLTESPPNAVKVEITGEQFLWNIRYPGTDGTFGRTDPRLYQKAGNTVGVVPDDPAGRDDIILVNRLVVPVNTPVELSLKSKDVLHSFFMPDLRIKQDAVPGLVIPLRFTADETGRFEVVCAELCGLTHYRMFAFLEVKTAEEYAAFLQEEDALQDWR